jgi:hypothetical protein
MQRGGFDRGAEGGARSAMLLAMGAGVKAGMANQVQPRWWCVPEHALDEVVHAQAQGLAPSIAVVGVGHAHELVVDHGQRSIAGQRPALDVARQVQRDAARMAVGWLDLDVPVRAVQRTNAVGAAERAAP